MQDHYLAGGGITLNMSTRLSFAGFGGVDLRGSLSDSGAFALQAGPVSFTPGGFPLSNSQLRFSRSPQAAARLGFDAALQVPLGPGAQLSGTIGGGGDWDLTGTLSGGRLGTFDFGDLRFNLTGPPTTPTLSSTGLVNVLDLGSLGFSGVISANGSHALTNVFTGPTFFSFPANSITNVIRRSTGDYRSVVLADNPVAYWRLNEASVADKVSDNAGLHAGIFNGSVQVQQKGALAGSTDRAVRFDGNSGFVSSPREFDFDFTKAVTVETWMQVDKGGWLHDWEAVVTKGDSAWRMSRYSNTRKVSFETTSGAGAHSLPSLRDLDDGLWHHVVGVYDGLAKSLYVDGVLEAWAAYSETLNRNNAPVLIGSNAEAPGRFFHGLLDEVALYGRALTAADILDHFQAGGGSILTTRLKLGFGGPIGSVELSGALSQNGAASLQASVSSLGLRGFTMNNTFVTFARTSGGLAAINLGGDLSLGSLDFAPHLTGTLSSSGFLGLGIDGVSGNVRGFRFNNLALAVIGNVGASSGSLAISGDLGLLNFPSYHLGGSISSQDFVGMNYSAGLSFGGFAAGSGTITFSSFIGMRASGQFDLTIPNPTPGNPAIVFNNSVLFTGDIGKDGSFALQGKGSLNIGGHATTTNTFTLDSTRVTGNTALQMGGVAKDINVAVSLDASGVSVSGSGGVDTDWQKVFDWPPPGDSVGDVWWRAKGLLSLSSSLGGSITGRLDGTFAIWEGLFGKVARPQDIESASEKLHSGWDLDTNGGAKVNYTFKGLTIDFTKVPPQFKQTDWGLDLW